MIKILLSILFILGIVVSDTSAQTINLKVKDVGIGTNYSEVLRKLGKPLSKRNNGKFPCNEGKVITLNYAGLTLKFIKNNEDDNFFVASVNITSNNFPVSGIKIGSTVKDVKTKFGNTDVKTKNGLNTLTYFIDDGYAYFYFIKGKLTKVSWELNVC